MKTLYLECNMGAAGDMLTAALCELLPDPDAFIAQMNAIGIPGLEMSREIKTSCGVRGTHISVKINGEEEVVYDVHPGEKCPEHTHAHAHEHSHEHRHSHAGLEDVRAIVMQTALPESVKADAMAVYGLIAEAEAHVHGSDIECVHFHEVGMMDAIADVSAVCLLMHLLAPDCVIASPLCTGYGEVHCMHGILPVPTPATARLLRGLPSYAGHVRGELLTPTGAALIRHFADAFEQRPMMRVNAIGCGLGMKEFDTANCVRAMLGEVESGADEVLEISCNLDDMTGEALGYAMEKLFAAGALDAYFTPIQMKKNRPAVKLSAICRPQDETAVSDAMLRHTTTLGVRMQRFARKTLERGHETMRTPYGDIDLKTAKFGDITKRKPEFDSLVRAAERSGATLAEVRSAIEKE